MKETLTHIGSFAVRKNPGGDGDWQVLLIKRDPKQEKYYLPNGRIEKAETEIGTGQRNLDEETGIKNTKLLADLGVVRRAGRNEAGQKYPKVIRYLLFQTNKTRKNEEWQTKEKDGRSFYCRFLPLGDFANQIQFRQETHLAHLATKFLNQLQERATRSKSSASAHKKKPTDQEHNA